MRLAPGFEIIQTAFGNRPLNLVLITGRQAALVDAGLIGTPQEAVLPVLAALGLAARDLSLVIVTHAHADHFGGNEELLQASEGRTRFAAHRLDTPWVEDPPAWTRRAYGHYVDLGLMTAADLNNAVAVSGNGVPVQHVLEGGEVFDLGDDLELEIHFTPGHSAGHICVLERNHRVLIQGEAAAGVAQYDVEGRLLTVPYYEDLEVYLRSLAHIAGLDFVTFVPSHLPVMDRVAAARFLGDSVDFALRFEAEVCERLASYPRPVIALELWRSLDRLWGQYPADLGLYMLLETHLNGLVRRGQATGSLTTGLTWVGGAPPALDLAADGERARAAIARMTA